MKKARMFLVPGATPLSASTVATNMRHPKLPRDFGPSFIVVCLHSRKTNVLKVVVSTTSLSSPWADCSDVALTFGPVDCLVSQVELLKETKTTDGQISAD